MEAVPPSPVEGKKVFSEGRGGIRSFRKEEAILPLRPARVERIRGGSLLGERMEKKSGLSTREIDRDLRGD